MSFPRIPTAFLAASLALLLGCQPVSPGPAAQPSAPTINPPTGFTADSAMVVSAHPEATRIGVDILKKGGNAADAAVAVQFALAVCFPYAGNIGGGGFLLMHTADGQNTALDFRETGPAAAHKDMYLNPSGEIVPGIGSAGILSVGVPGTVDGMAQLHARFGHLPWAQLLQPAIDLARLGYPATAHDAGWLNRTKADFIRYNPQGSHYMVKQGEWKSGDSIFQPDLAKTLERIRDLGRAGFYAGETAALLLGRMRELGGIITQGDLDTYKSVWREPLQGKYKELEIMTMPPPSSGGLVLLQALAMVEPYPLQEWGADDPRSIHLLTEALRRAFADRAEHVGDPAFWENNPHLLDKAYLLGRMQDFNPNKATPSAATTHGNPGGHDETTHFSIVDPQGNAVAVTTTVNGPFGSKVWVPGAGFLLNNEMDDFSAKPGAANIYGLTGNEANSIAPGKRMLSSMTPTIVLRDKKVMMVLGTPGGSTIPVSVLQCILNVVEHRMNMDQAVRRKRFHHQWLPDEIAVEDSVFPAATWDALREMGHQVCLREAIGRVDAILVHPGGLLEGGADPRRDDVAGGF